MISALSPLWLKVTLGMISNLSKLTEAGFAVQDMGVRDIQSMGA